MTFPKAPTKKPSGKLRLIIRPADREVQVDTGPPEIPAGPQDGIINFKLPAGFSMDNNLDDLLLRQTNAALISLIEIEKRYNKCRPCRDKGYNPEAIEKARDVIKIVHSFLKGAIKSVPKMLISHEKDGNLWLNVEYCGRLMVVFFGSPEIPPQIQRSFGEEHSEFPLVDRELEVSLNWLLE